MCISLHSVILDIAQTCALVDHEALASMVEQGAGRSTVHRQWQVAAQPEIQGSPHVFTATGFVRHNPGVTYCWTDTPPAFGGCGFPRLDGYSTDWTSELLNQLSAKPESIANTIP